MIELDDIKTAAERIAGHVRRTPLMAATALEAPPTRAALHLKLECLQASGSFKARGATNKLLATPPEALKAGVVTASGGNHGLAVARAARSIGASATIFVTTSTTQAKVDKLNALGADVTVIGSVWNETNEHALAFADRHGAAYFHPFADPLVVAGQGTLALEILDQNPGLDTVLIAIGGGGLITGMSVALKALKPDIRIIGIEPVGAPTFHASVAAGGVVALDAVTTRVATMACAKTDEALFERARPLIDEIVLLEDAEMLDAAKWLWFEMGLAADLSGAAAVAALRTGKVALPPDAVACALVCGAGPDALMD
ncbi:MULTISPECIES: threonine/serine dehydratase [unclassified Roseitalea]|uniref:threonine ammonia-lyase n=1 Tax=unclassified Roseitalea TaxID=2639107 RepID=UPI00273E4650|nr:MULTISPECIES: threonine/serine dehydratase [unclassified Roseitalea]